MIFVTEPTEFVGYHLANAYVLGSAEEDLPTLDTKGRFWLMTANTDNLFPDRLVPHSDTANIEGGSSFEVNLGYASPHMHNPFPLLYADYTYDIHLSNPVRLDVAGMYWIGSSITSYGGSTTGGKLRASQVVGMQRGLNDLHFTGATPTNMQGPSYTWTMPERLTDEGVEVLSSPDLWPFIDIWLICQQLTPGVPYGPS